MIASPSLHPRDSLKSNMKDFIQKSGEEVAIVIYDAPLPPKYFRFSKKFIRTLFVVAPLLLILVFLALFFWGFGSRLKETPTPQFPQVLDQNEAKIVELQKELQLLQESNSQLVSKLTSQPSQTMGDEPYLMAIKKPYGMQNLAQLNRVSLDRFELKQDPKKVTLNFQIISSNPETRVTGHVIVFMISETGIMAYPREANAALASGIKYSLGEPFSISRLRPTSADFPYIPKGESVKFMIYIFNREGDLLLTSETQPFKLGVTNDQ
jgi:hypothetical protein